MNDLKHKFKLLLFIKKHNILVTNDEGLGEEDYFDIILPTDLSIRYNKEVFKIRDIVKDAKRWNPLKTSFMANHIEWYFGDTIMYGGVITNRYFRKEKLWANLDKVREIVVQSQHE